MSDPSIHPTANHCDRTPSTGRITDKEFGSSRDCVEVDGATGNAGASGSRVADPIFRGTERAIKGAKHLCGMFGMFFMVAACLLQSSCMVAGEKVVSPDGTQSTRVLAMVGTDASSLPMPYGDNLEATGVNQSKAVATTATGVVSGMAVQAYRAVQTGAQGVDRALSKHSTSAAINADNNATKAAINADNNALKEAELFSGQ